MRNIFIILAFVTSCGAIALPPPKPVKHVDIADDAEVVQDDEPSIQDPLPSTFDPQQCQFDACNPPPERPSWATMPVPDKER